MSEWIDRLRSMLEAMTARERVLVMAAGGVIALALVLFGIINPILAGLDNAALRVETAERQLLLSATLGREYESVNKSLLDKKRIIEQGPRGQILSKLESLARTSNIPVDSMAPESAGRNENYVETKVLVNLKGVALRDVVSYLSRIESARENFSIKTLRIQSDRSEPDQLNVTFTVSSFEPI